MPRGQQLNLSGSSTDDEYAEAIEQKNDALAAELAQTEQQITELHKTVAQLFLNTSLDNFFKSLNEKVVSLPAESIEQPNAKVQTKQKNVSHIPQENTSYQHRQSLMDNVKRLHFDSLKFDLIDTDPVYYSQKLAHCGESGKQLKLILKDIKNSIICPQSISPPSIFISYNWLVKENRSAQIILHNKELIQPFLHQLHKDLRKAGAAVFLDIKDCPYNIDFDQYAKDKIENCQYILLIAIESLLSESKLGMSDICNEIKAIRGIRSANLKLEQNSGIFPIMLTSSLLNGLPQEYEQYVTVRDYRTKPYTTYLKELLASIANVKGNNRKFEKIWQSKTLNNQDEAQNSAHTSEKGGSNDTLQQDSIIKYKLAQSILKQSVIGKNVAPGKSDNNFVKHILDNNLFVDKSLFIKQVIDDTSLISLIVRPRRFGKTTNMKMLCSFLKLTSRPDEFDKIKKAFESLKIWYIDDGKYQEHLGKYPVIFLSFKDIKSKDFNLSYRKFITMIQQAYDEHNYLYESPELTKTEKNTFKRILDANPDDINIKNVGQYLRGTVENSLKDLSKYLYKHYKKECYILIDEYDTPIQAAIHNEAYFIEMISFIQVFLGSALKDNLSLQKGILTGILRISKEKLFSDLNNFQVYGILNEKYEQFFGFLEQEVIEFVGKQHWEKYKGDIRDWYGGCSAGRLVLGLYNPWSVTNFVHLNFQLDYYYSNTAENIILKEYLKFVPNKIKEDMLRLVNGEWIIIRADNHISLKGSLSNFNKICGDEVFHFLMNYLLLSGNLSGIKYDLVCDGNNKPVKINKVGDISLVVFISNREAYRFFYDIVNSWFPDREFKEFTQANQIITQNAPQNHKKIFDLIKKNKEYFTPSISSRLPPQNFRDNIDQLLARYKNNLVITKLFCYASLLSHDCIPDSLLLKLSNKQNDISTFINELERYHLIKRDPQQETLSIDKDAHEYLDFSFQKPICLHNLKECLFKLMMVLIKEFVFDELTYFNSESFKKQKLYYKHVSRLVCMDRVRSTGFNEIIELYYHIAFYELYINVNGLLAIAYFENFIEKHNNATNKKGITEINLKVAAAKSCIGEAYYRLDRFEDAYEAFEKADNILENCCTSKREKQQLRAINFLRWAELNIILKYYNKALEKYNTIITYLPDKDISNKNLIEYVKLRKLTIELSQGKLSLSVGIKRADEVRKIYMDICKDSNSTFFQAKTYLVAKIKFALAHIYMYTEKTKERIKACENLNEAETIIENLFGHSNYELAKILEVQLVLHDLYGDYSKRYDKIIKIYQQYFEMSNTVFNRAFQRMGDIYEELGYPHQALQYYQNVDKSYHITFADKKNYDRIVCLLLNSIGGASLAIGEIEEAKEYYEKGMKSCKKYYGEDLNYLVFLFNLGELALMSYDLSTAKVHLKEAYSLAKQHLGETHIKTLTIYSRLRKLEFLEGNYTYLRINPETILHELCEAINDSGYEVKEVAAVMIEYGCMYLSIWNLSQAQIFFKVAMNQLQEEHSAKNIEKGKKHPRYAICISELIKTCAFSYEFEKSLSYILEAHEIFRVHTWETFPSYQRFKSNIAIVLYLIETVPKSRRSSNIKKIYDKIIHIMDLGGYQNPLKFLLLTVRKQYKKNCCYFKLDYIDTYQLLGKYYFHTGKIFKAYKQFLEAKKLYKEYKIYSYVKHMELDFCIARVQEKLGDNNRATEIFKSTIERMLLPHHSNTIINLTKRLKAVGLFGFVDKNCIALKLNNARHYEITRSEINYTQQEKDAISCFFKHYKNALNETISNLDKDMILTSLISLEIALGNYDNVESYLKEYSNTELFLHLLLLADYIPTSCNKLRDEMRELEDEKIFKLAHSKFRRYALCMMYHNYGCYLQVQSIEERLLFDCNDTQSFETSSELYKKSLDIYKTAFNLCGYINNLYLRKKFNEVQKELIKDQKLKPIPTGRQSYTDHEKPSLPDVLQKPIETEKTIYLDQKVLIFYIISLCFSEQAKDNISGYTLKQHILEFEKYVINESRSNNKSKALCLSYFLLAHALFKHYLDYVKNDIVSNLIVKAEEYANKVSKLYKSLHNNSECAYVKPLLGKLAKVSKKASLRMKFDNNRLSPQLSKHGSILEKKNRQLFKISKSRPSEIVKGAEKKYHTSPTTCRKSMLKYRKSELNQSQKKLYDKLKRKLSKTFLPCFDWDIALGEFAVTVSIAFVDLRVILKKELLIELRSIIYDVFKKCDYVSLEVKLYENYLVVVTLTPLSLQLIHNCIKGGLSKLDRPEKINLPTHNPNDFIWKRKRNVSPKNSRSFIDKSTSYGYFSLDNQEKKILSSSSKSICQAEEMTEELPSNQNLQFQLEEDEQIAKIDLPL